jgi:hypothetical protein
MKYRLLLACAVAVLAACTQPQSAAVASAVAATVPEAAAAPAKPQVVPSRKASPLPHMVVHKSATCGCCAAWVDHVRHAGFEVEVRDEVELGAVKDKLGVPADMVSCHTAVVGGYYIEGHVPADDIKRLLAERPKAKGLVLPGMPMGSPGMEMPDGRAQPYAVGLVKADGTTQVFASH